MTTGGYYVPVVTTGRFSDAPGSIYRSILSSCRYYLEDFDCRSILVDSGTIVQWSRMTTLSEKKKAVGGQVWMDVPYFDAYSDL